MSAAVPAHGRSLGRDPRCRRCQGIIDTPGRQASLGLARAFQEIAIATADELHAITSETNDRFAQGVARPRRRLDVVLRVQHRRNGAITLALDPCIDGAQHLAQALSALRCDPWIRRRGWRVRSAPKASKRLQPVGGQGIQKDERGGRSSGFGKADEACAHEFIADGDAGV